MNPSLFYEIGVNASPWLYVPVCIPQASRSSMPNGAKCKVNAHTTSRTPAYNEPFTTVTVLRHPLLKFMLPAANTNPSVPSQTSNHARSLSPSLRAVQRTQVAIPANADDVDKQHAVVQRDELEVDGLHKGPDHVVGGEGVLVVLVELVADRAALEHGHGGEEHADGAGRKDALVESDTREDCGVGGAQVYICG